MGSGWDYLSSVLQEGDVSLGDKRLDIGLVDSIDSAPFFTIAMILSLFLPGYKYIHSIGLGVGFSIKEEYSI